MPYSFTRCAQAVREIPQSVKIWTRAADLEGDRQGKRKVLRKVRKPNLSAIYNQTLTLVKGVIPAVNPNPNPVVS